MKTINAFLEVMRATPRLMGERFSHWHARCTTKALLRRIDDMCFKSCWQNPTLNEIRALVRDVH